MPFADPADRREYKRAYRSPNHHLYLEKMREYAVLHKAARRARSDKWRKDNMARTRALDRLRYLRSKESLSAGELAQVAEILEKYPKRRIYLGPN